MADSEPARIFTRLAFANGGDDPIPALVYSEATDENEVAVHLGAAHDYMDDAPQFSAYLPALDALAVAKQIEEAARNSLSSR